jgi:hypothetical protein
MSRKKHPAVRLSVTTLEERHTPTASTAAPFALGVPDGQAGDPVVYNADRSVDFTVANPYGASFIGGVRVALADVTGDGTADLITAPGPGTAPTIHVFDGVTHSEVAAFDAYEASFTGGVYVAAADLTGDGMAEIITGADQGGGPRVVVFDGSTVSGTATPKSLDDFLAIDDSSFRGGVRLATGDVNGDGTADLVVGAGFGGGPRVVVYDGAALGQGTQTKLVADFFAFEDTLRNGVFPAVGDLNGDGCGDLIFGAGPGGGPRVRGLDGRAALAGLQSDLTNFFAGDPNSRLGVEVSTTTDANGNTVIVGSDLQTKSTAVFGPGGSPEGQFGDRGPGRSGHPAPGTDTDDTAPIAVTQDTADALVASYEGSGSGSLTTYTRGGTPTTADATADVTLDVTAATLLYPRSRSGQMSTTAYGVELTGNLTVSINGAAATTVAFTGMFRLTADPSTNGGTITGSLLGTEPHTPGQTSPPTVDFNLEGTLSGTSLTIDHLSVAEQMDTNTVTVFRAPASADATKIVLNMA